MAKGWAAHGPGCGLCVPPSALPAGCRPTPRPHLSVPGVTRGRCLQFPPNILPGPSGRPQVTHGLGFYVPIDTGRLEEQSVTNTVSGPPGEKALSILSTEPFSLSEGPRGHQSRSASFCCQLSLARADIASEGCSRDSVPSSLQTRALGREW